MSSIYYTDSGEGLPIVFIHGFCETHELWNDFVQPLTKDYRVLTIDLPGFGKSALPETEITIDAIARLVIEWLNEIRISKAILIGHSLGGYVALSITEQCPDLVIGLALFHSTAYADTEVKKVTRDKVIRFVERHGVERYIFTYVPDLFAKRNDPYISEIREIALETEAKTLISYTKAMRDRSEKTSVLENFRNPVLLLTGAKDPIIPCKTVEEQVTLSPHSAFILLQESAHMGMLEEKEKACDAIGKFASKCKSSV